MGSTKKIGNSITGTAPVSGLPGVVDYHDQDMFFRYEKLTVVSLTYLDKMVIKLSRDSLDLISKLVLQD